MTDKPVLRDLYDRVADELGPRLTELTASDGFASAVEIAGAARDRAAVELQRSSRRFLHAWNLPAGADITVLRQEIGALDRNVRALARQVEELQQQLAASKARPSQSRPTQRRKAG